MAPDFKRSQFRINERKTMTGLSVQIRFGTVISPNQGLNEINRLSRIEEHGHQKLKPASLESETHRHPFNERLNRAHLEETCCKN